MAKKLTDKQVKDLNIEFEETKDKLEEVFDVTSNIQDSLKNQLDSLKNINSQYQSNISLQDKLNLALQESRDNQKSIDKTVDKIGKGSAALQKIGQQINDGFRVKNNLTRQLNVLKKLENDLEQANLDVQNKNANAKVRQKDITEQIQKQLLVVQDTQEKINELNKIALTDQTDLEKAYGKNAAKLINQLITLKAQQEEIGKIEKSLKAQATRQQNQPNNQPGNQPNTNSFQDKIDKLNEDYKQTQNLLGNIYEISNNTRDTLRSQLEASKELIKEGGNQFILTRKLEEAKTKLEKSEQNVLNISEELANISLNQDNVEQKIIEGFKAKNTLSGQLTELRKKENDLIIIQNKLNSGQIKDQNELNNLEQQFLKVNKQVLDAKETVQESQDKIAELSRLASLNEEQLVKKYGEQGAELVSQLITALQQEEIDTNLVQNLKAKLKFAKANNDKAKDYRDLLKEHLKLTDKQQQSLRGIGDALGVNKLLAGLTLAGIIKGVLDLDQANTDFGRSIGVNKDVADSITESFKKTQFEASALNKNLDASVFTARNNIEAQNDLNKAFNTGNVFTKKQASDQTFLTKQLGLQGEEAANILKIGLLNNQSAEDVQNTVADTVVKLRAQTGVALNFRNVLIEVGKISGQLAVQYKNNPKLLAQAVIQAQLLGLTLADAKKQAETLLDFEKSIESELKAELLTGKALNFEKARALALQGKSAEAAAELMKEAGGLEEFQKLNVIQQNALSDAIGLTSDQMADALKKQKLLKETGFGSVEQLKDRADSIKDETARQLFLNQIRQTADGAQLVKQYEQISLQEKFNALIATLQETLVMIGEGPIVSILTGFASILQSASALKTLVYTIATIMGISWGASIAKSIGGLLTMAIEMGAITALSTTTNAMLTFGVGAVVALATIAGTIAAISSISGNNEVGSLSSGGGGGGISGGGGGTGVNINQSAAATNMSNNNDKMLEALNKNNSLLEKSLTKSQNVNATLEIKGEQVGTLSTQQSQNTVKNIG